MPSTPVSVVILVDNRRMMLARTLACLVHQTYPLHLIEVVLADGGSADLRDQALDSIQEHFSGVRYTSHERDGFGVAARRNAGIRTATHENVILLDCDMAPTPRLVELYVRHLQAFPNAVYCGHRRAVDANNVSAEAVRTSITPMLALHDIETKHERVRRVDASRTTDRRLRGDATTDDLRFERHPFRVVDGGNLGFTKSLFDIAGDFTAGFTDRGAEDVEWGFRVWNRGFYIAPLIDACGLHQASPGGHHERGREVDRIRSTPMLTDLCPLRFRPANNDGGFTVPLVSIYIPAYNAQDTVVASVQSALNQTFRDLEVCVVNDGSTDLTVARLTEHFGGDPRVRIATQKNGGIGAASNRAVRMCRGAFIGHLDADDELTPDAVELMLPPMLQETRIGVAYGSHVKIDPDGKLIGDAWVAPRYSNFMLLHAMIVHPFRLFRARDWHRTAGFAEDIRNAVDYDMFLKLSEVTEMVHVDERVYRYRIHDASTSRKHQATQYRNHAIVVGRALERRGLAVDWAMEPLDPDDPRKYRFVETAGARQQFGLPTSRIRVVGTAADIQSKAVSVFPTWKFETGDDAAPVDLMSPRLSRARALRCADMLRAGLVETDAEVEIAT